MSRRTYYCTTSYKALRVQEKAEFEAAKLYFKSQLRPAAQKKPLFGIDKNAIEQMETHISSPFRWQLHCPKDINPWHRSCQAYLLYGPEGCGQSTLVVHMAKECNIPYLPVSFYDIQSPFELMDFEPRLRALFQVAEENQPCLVYIDQVELKGMTWYEGELILRKIIGKMHGIVYDLGEKNVKVLLLMGTNSPWEIIGNIVRRFKGTFHVRAPNAHERIELIKSTLKGHHIRWLTDKNLDTLAAAAIDYRHADLYAILEMSTRMLDSATHFRKLKIRQNVSIWQRLGCCAMPEARFLFEPCYDLNDENAVAMTFFDVPDVAKKATIFKCIVVNLYRHRDARIDSDIRLNMQRFEQMRYDKW